MSRSRAQLAALATAWQGGLRLVRCGPHSSAAVGLDWSWCGRRLRSWCTGRELMLWDVSTAACKYSLHVALGRLSASEATVLLSTEPLWAALFAAGLLGESTATYFCMST